MDGRNFDRIARSLVRHGPRRDAIKTVAGSGITAFSAWLGLGNAVAKRRRCRKRRRTCGGKKKCCGNNTACRSFPTESCTTLSGRLCCGLEGAPCDNSIDINNCDCCDGLFCGGPVGEQGRCQEEPV